MKKILAGALIVIASIIMMSAPNVFAQGEPCTADFDCNGNVDATDVGTFLGQFGRSQYNDPCPDCYDSPCPCSACPLGQTDCDGTCVDTNTDEDHCGSCGVLCPSGNLCVAGSCVLSCQTELTDCAGICVNTDTDEDNCGSCGTACGSGEMCVASTCEASGGDSNGSPCIQSLDCLSGYCVDGVCCDAQCAGLCVSCLASETGAVDGSCSPIIAGTDPHSECVDPEICDGAGGCANP